MPVYLCIYICTHTGIAGRLCPRYRLFGDSINTAARMCSISDFNTITLSRAHMQQLVQTPPPETGTGGGGEGTMAVPQATLMCDVCVAGDGVCVCVVLLQCVAAAWCCGVVCCCCVMLQDV